MKIGPIALLLFPADVARQAVLVQDAPLQRLDHHSAGARAPRLAAPRIGGPASVSIGVRINRVVQQIAQRLMVRAAPLQVALAQAPAQPIGQQDLVAHQILQQAMDAAQAPKLDEYQ